MCLTMQSFKTLFKSDDLLAEGLMTFKVISFNLLKLRVNFHFQTFGFHGKRNRSFTTYTTFSKNLTFLSPDVHTYVVPPPLKKCLTLKLRN